MVVKLGAGFADALGRDCVHAHGLAFLHGIPHEHAIGTDLDEALVGQIVPARDREGRWNAQVTGGFT